MKTSMHFGNWLFVFGILLGLALTSGCGLIEISAERHDWPKPVAHAPVGKTQAEVNEDARACAPARRYYDCLMRLGYTITSDRETQ